jgi:hypothetical protein
VESYFWVAKEVFWDAVVELPRCYGLLGGLEQGLTNGCKRYTLVPSLKKGEDQVATS